MAYLHYLKRRKLFLILPHHPNTSIFFVVLVPLSRPSFDGRSSSSLASHPPKITSSPSHSSENYVLSLFCLSSKILIVAASHPRPVPVWYDSQELTMISSRRRCSLSPGPLPLRRPREAASGGNSTPPVWGTTLTSLAPALSLVRNSSVRPTPNLLVSTWSYMLLIYSVWWSFRCELLNYFGISSNTHLSIHFLFRSVYLYLVWKICVLAVSRSCCRRTQFVCFCCSGIRGTQNYTRTFLALNMWLIAQMITFWLCRF
jgi:hypothetical protein